MALGDRRGPGMPPRGMAPSPYEKTPPAPAPTQGYGAATGLGGNRSGMRTGSATGFYGRQPTFGSRGLGGQMSTEGDPYGSQSGPGILESWFNQRAAGTDPAYDYSMKRGMEALGNRSAAAGNFNSGAARQQESDFAANMAAQRMGQLDALAGGASGEHLGRLGLMFQQGLGIAGGQAGQASAYDLGAAGNMAAANQAQQQMFLNKAGVDQQAAQAGINNLLGIYAAYQSGGKAGGSGGMYDPYKV